MLVVFVLLMMHTHNYIQGKIQSLRFVQLLLVNVGHLSFAYDTHTHNYICVYWLCATTSCTN